MLEASQENQLELFDVTSGAVPPPHRGMWGRLSLHLRYDQCVLVGIAGLIGLTIVFACGVERGKQLARTERPLLAHQEAVAPQAGKTTPARSATSVAAPTVPKAKEPVRRAAKSRYAVQVVTFSRPQLAKQELERLRAKGEPAFLIIREGRTSVYVGPFPSKGHAAEKLALLKSRYQDCFVKTL